MERRVIGAICWLACVAVAQDYELLIRGGRIVDGTGNPVVLRRRSHLGPSHRRPGSSRWEDGPARD